jgi:hypothetical protein
VARDVPRTRRGERLHPATRLIVNESAHVEGWGGDHELHAFNALWDMDEIMAATFMTFADVVEREPYDLWGGDEGWDLDYFLHENPELKRAPDVFMTDFIGMLPMRDDPASLEFKRAWERNAENIDHLRFHPDVRDLSLMVGDEEDVLDREFGPGLPNMRQWAREHFRFSGYTHHFDPARYRDKAALRGELGFREDERVILASVGGTRAGRTLLGKCARMMLVAGPRLPADELPRGPQIDVRAFVPDLFRHHAAAHLAIVQGGLSTTMASSRSASLPSGSGPRTSRCSPSTSCGSIASAPGARCPRSRRRRCGISGPTRSRETCASSRTRSSARWPSPTPAARSAPSTSPSASGPGGRGPRRRVPSTTPSRSSSGG